MKSFSALLLLCLVVYSQSVPKGRRDTESEWIPGGIRGPLKSFVSEQLNSILASLASQSGHLSENLRQHLKLLVSLVKPFWRNIIRNGKAAGKTIQELKNEIREYFGKFISSMIDITDENVGALKAVLQYIVDIIFDRDAKVPKPRDAIAFHSESYFLVDKVIRKILSPVLKKTTAILEKIAELSEDKSAEAQKKLNVYWNELIEVLKPHALRIIDILQDMGIKAKDSLKFMENTFRFFIKSMRGLSEARKNIFYGLLDYAFRLLTGRITDPNAAEDESYFIIDRVISKILSPIIEKLNQQLDSLKQAIKQQSANVIEATKKHAENIAELIRPHMIQIINILNDLGVDSADALEQIKKALNMLIGNVRGISKENIELFRTLIDYVAKVLLEGKTPDKMAVNAEGLDGEAYLIIDRIISRILSPIIKKVNEQLESLKESIKQQSSNAIEITKKHAENIAELIRPFMIRIINILNDLGVETSDALEEIKKSLKLIFDNIRGISKENIKLLKSLVDYVAKVLLEGKTPDQAQTFAIDSKYDISQFLIKDILEKLLKPLANLIMQHLKSIKQSLKDHAGDLTDTIKQHIRNLAKILKPTVEAIIKNHQGIVDSNANILQQVIEALQYLIGIVERLSGISLNLSQKLLRYLAEAILGNKME